MRLRGTTVVDAQSIATGGTNISEKVTATHPITHLTLSQVGANVSDEATLAEILAGFGTVEMTVPGLGTIIQWDADDLFYFNRDVIPKSYPFVSRFESDTDNDIRETTLVLPLSPAGIDNIGDATYGLPANSDATLKVSTGTDTAAGMDARAVTVQGFGPAEGRPSHILGSFMDSFTPSATPGNFQKINDARISALMGAFIFATTSREDLGATDAPTLKNMGYAYGKSSQELFFADALLGMRSNMYQWPVVHTHGNICGSGGAESDSTRAVAEYYFADFGMRIGGVPATPTMDVRVQVDAGVADACRLYPLVAHQIA